MSEELDLINQSAERLFADHVDAELHDAVAAGGWPTALWDAVTAVGFERAEMTVLGVGLARIAGRFVAPIPLVETILTASLLKERPVYKCGHCGFPAKLLHWRCPGCKHWSSVRPIHGIEGE